MKAKIFLDSEVYSSGQAVKQIIELYAKRNRSKSVDELTEIFGNPHNALFADSKKAKTEIAGRLRYNQEPITIKGKKVYVSNQITTEYALSVIKIAKNKINEKIKIEKV